MSLPFADSQYSPSMARSVLCPNALPELPLFPAASLGLLWLTETCVEVDLLEMDWSLDDRLTESVVEDYVLVF